MRAICIYILSGCISLILSSCDSNQANNDHKLKKDEGKKDKNKSTESLASNNLKIEEKWELPPILQEISGIAYLSPNRFACVQDESGVIFIYNTAQNKVEKQISFGAAGDYEGLAIAGKTAYVVRSDGHLFRIKDLESSKNHDIKSFDTGLTAKNDVEGLAYDAKNNRLLLAIKGAETGKKDYKGVYAFNLKSDKMEPEPVFKINLTDSVFSNKSSKKLSNAIQPADIAVNPVTQDIYIIEATNPQLLILDAAGTIKNRLVLNEETFQQPEGMDFSPNGDLYISNESRKERANLLKVILSGLPDQM